MRKPIDVFDEWAELGKDKGMEDGHASSVSKMLKFSLDERSVIGNDFKFLDLGCGNGWVVRKVINNPLCKRATGIDGASQMIKLAKSKVIANEEYLVADIDNYQPLQPFDLILSMEVLYYLKDPATVIKKIHKSWLNPNGRLIIGIDLYYENHDSHTWQDKIGTPMLMLKEDEWVGLMIDAGFREIQSWRVNAYKKWSGTLVLTGIR